VSGGALVVRRKDDGMSTTQILGFLRCRQVFIHRLQIYWYACRRPVNCFQANHRKRIAPPMEKGPIISWTAYPAEKKPPFANSRQFMRRAASAINYIHL